MTSIILIVIGILLAAVAVLMTVFYGGSAFDSGSVKAHAASLDNAAMSVTSAAHLYMAEKSETPTDMAALTSGNYLSQNPELSGIGTPSPTWRMISPNQDGTDERPAYVVDSVPGEVCLALLHLHKQDDVAIPSLPGKDPTGCYQPSSGTDAVFYAYLPTTGGTTTAATGGGTTAPAKPSDPTSPAAPVGTAADQHAAAVRAVGTTVAAAIRSFGMATGRTPSSDSDLVPDYITTIPTSPYATVQPWTWYAVGSRSLYQLSVPDVEDCKAINAASNNGYGYSVIPGGSERGVDEGCYQNGDLGLIYVRWTQL